MSEHVSPNSFFLLRFQLLVTLLNVKLDEASTIANPRHNDSCGAHIENGQWDHRNLALPYHDAPKVKTDEDQESEVDCALESK